MQSFFKILTGLSLILSISAVRADYSETTGEITLEAEDYHGISAPGTTNDAWSQVCTTGTFSADAAVFVGPDDGDNILGPLETNPGPGDPVNDSPRLSYNINFMNNGNYSIWLKGLKSGAGAGSDSVHVGIDGDPTFDDPNLATIDLSAGTPDFTWTSARAGTGGGGSPIIFVISDAPSSHTFDLWMREDGVFIDKILLTSIGTDPTVSEPTADDPTAGGGVIPTVAAPAITPNGGAIISTDTVSLSTCTNGASVYYTNDATDPTPDGTNPSTTLFSQPFLISAFPEEIRAIASVSPGVTRSDSTITSATFTLNQDPVVDTPIGAQNATEATPFNLDISGNFSDPDGDTLTFGISGRPVATGLIIDTDTGVISGTPTQADATASPISLTVTASDGKGGTDAQDTFSLTVTDVNQDPEPDPNNPIGPQTGTQGSGFNLDVSGSFIDPDGDSLTYSISGLPAGTGLSIDPDTGVISGTPTAADEMASPISVTVTASDTMGGADAQIMFDLTIEPGGGKEDIIVDFGGSGLWTYLNDSNWLQLNGGSPERSVAGDLDGSEQDDVIADFGTSGIWVRRDLGAWIKLNGGTSEQLAVGDLDNSGKDDLIVDFGAAGLWAYMNDVNWIQLNSGSPEQVVTADVDGNGEDDVVGDFGASGVWIKRNQGGWTQLNTLGSEAMAVGDLDDNGNDDVLIDFGISGLWAYMNGATWLKVLSSSPDLITTGDVDGNGADDILASFATSGAGLWQKLNLGAWSQLNTLAPDRLVTADVDDSGKDDIIATFTSTAAGIFIKRNQVPWVLLNGQTPESLVPGEIDGQ